jgi:FkbM family methyltransferase
MPSIHWWIGSIVGAMSLTVRPWEQVRYLLYRNRSAARGKEAIFHPRALSGTPVVCRAGTTDAGVLADTFLGLFHVPAVPLNSDGLILDLGANVGYVAAHLATLYPSTRVLAVELDAGNADVARRNVAPYGGRCEVVTAGIWSHDGEIVYEGDKEWGFRIVGSTDADPPSNVRRAPAITIDTLLRDADAKRIAYLKMDIEGAENEVLRNGGEWLERTAQMKVEVHPPATVAEVETLLRRAGFVTRRDDRHRAAVIGIRNLDG